MKYNIWVFIWDTTEIVHKYTGIDIAAPIEYFYPNFSPWLFGKMIGIKGVKIKENKND